MRQRTWLAREGAELDGGTMATIKAAVARHDRMELYAPLQYVATLHCQVEKVKNADEFTPKPKGKCTLVASRKTYRCLRCGKTSGRLMITLGSFRGPEWMERGFNPEPRNNENRLHECCVYKW